MMVNLVSFTRLSPLLLVAALLVVGGLHSKKKAKKKEFHRGGAQSQNLGGAINSQYDESMPCISGNGRVIIYQSNRIVGGEEALEGGTGEENWDLWVSYRTDAGTWTAPAILEGVNSDYFDGHASLSSNGKKLYFVSNRPNGGEDMNIWFTRLRDGVWKKPLKLTKTINTSERETFPSIGPDGKTLYFTRKDGIYVAKRVNYRWQKPRRLPRAVNSGNDEAAPAIHIDGRTLYFSSKRRGGRGGYDLYLSRKRGRRWGRAVNLGAEINGPGNDLFVSIPGSGKFLYYSSERPGGFGGEDIYQVPLPPDLGPQGITLVNGKVFHVPSRKPVRAKIEIIDLKKRKVVAAKRTNRAGRYSFVLNSGQRYGVVVSAGGFYFISAYFDLRKEKHYREINKNFAMVALGQPGKLTLNNIFFARGSARILRESRFDLDRLVSLMKKNSYVKLEIGGHTDSRGGKAYNKKLSRKRAQSVRKYLVKGGVAASRLKAVGYGDEKPIASNETEKGRAQNRRTEFVIIK